MMSPLLPALCLLLVLGNEPVETRFAQVAPPVREGAAFTRSPAQARSVILIRGLHVHPFVDSQVRRATFPSWEQPGSTLVRSLAPDADVFAFTYGQAIPVGDVAALPSFRASVQDVRRMGYTEIVLVGFSAGGLIAREFVEDHPDAGVTKVVQVCPPNGGSNWAELSPGVRPSQQPFLESLTKRARTQCLRDRQDKRIPAGTEFVCVLGTGFGAGDGLVSTRSQWTEDLQEQGIPAVRLRTEHLAAVRGAEGARLIAALVRERQPRWDSARVAAMRKRLWGVSIPAP
jgi:pimeloyl-ACP methyl ester carboxylesterase